MLRRLRLLICLGGLLLGVPQRGAAFADSVEATGPLVAVTPRSVWVRRSNGVLVFAHLPDQGALSAQDLASRYKVGNEVFLKCALVELFRDDEENQWFDLEAKKLEYLRPPSAAELASALGSAARRLRGNLLRAAEGDQPPVSVSLKSLPLPDTSAAIPGKDDPAATLERSRALTQKWLAALPNFTADETALVYRSPIVSPPKWKVDVTVQSEVSFREAQDMHRNVVRNGEPWNDLYEHLPPDGRARSLQWVLARIFSADCDVTLEFARRAVEAGTPVLVYRYSAPPDSCFAPDWGGPGERYYAARSGEVSFAEADGLVRRMESKTSGYPKEFSMQSAEERATWDYIRIGEERHLLPTEVQDLLATRSSMSLAITKYKNHRHFEAFSDVKYK